MALVQLYTEWILEITNTVSADSARAFSFPNSHNNIGKIGIIFI